MTREPDREYLLTEISKRGAVFENHRDDILSLDQKPSQLYGASRHLMDAGGKRLRPVLSMIATEAVAGKPVDTIDYTSVLDVTGEPVNVLHAAAAVELIHTFSLIHDDVMDNDSMRRGEPTVHCKYDEPTAIISGDLLHSYAYNHLASSQADPQCVTDAVSRLTQTTIELCEGQARDIDLTGSEDVTTDDYMEMIQGKTAVLYGASAELPAILLGADENVRTALYKYGVDVGMAFQIYDDILDLTGNKTTLGKDWGSDLVERKRTLITIHALENGNPPEYIFPASDDADDLQKSVERLQESGSIEYARTIATELVESGIENLDTLDDTAAKEQLTMLARYLITRNK